MSVQIETTVCSDYFCAVLPHIFHTVFFLVVFICWLYGFCIVLCLPCVYCMFAIVYCRGSYVSKLPLSIEMWNLIVFHLWMFANLLF